MHLTRGFGQPRSFWLPPLVEFQREKEDEGPKSPVPCYLNETGSTDFQESRPIILSLSEMYPSPCQISYPVSLEIRGDICNSTGKLAVEPLVFSNAWVAMLVFTGVQNFILIPAAAQALSAGGKPCFCRLSLHID
jgi:hypothetical protein